MLGVIVPYSGPLCTLHPVEVWNKYEIKCRFCVTIHSTDEASDANNVGLYHPATYRINAILLTTQ